MAITQPFSLQGTTIEVFANDTTARQTALNVLLNAIKVATDNPTRAAAFTSYFADPSTAGTQSGTFAITTSGATGSNVDGFFSGTWSNAQGSGTWYSTASTATSITAQLIVNSATISGALTLAIGDLSSIFTSGNSAKGTPTAITGSPITLTTATGGASIGKITSAGDSGKTFAIVSAKLINESGTTKAKGSSDEGDFTIDYLSVPSDVGQIAMESAFNDETINGNRVFRVTHGASGQKLYFVGMVTELKKQRGTVDAFATVKAKITMQSGSAEFNPA